MLSKNAFASTRRLRRTLWPALARQLKRYGLKGTGPARTWGPRSDRSPHARRWLSWIWVPALLSVTGCSAFTREVVRTETVEVRVPVQAALPAELLAPCHPSATLGEPLTFEAYAGWVEDLVLTLEQCNQHKAEIRKLQPQT